MAMEAYAKALRTMPMHIADNAGYDSAELVAAPDWCGSNAAAGNNLAVGGGVGSLRGDGNSVSLDGTGKKLTNHITAITELSGGHADEG